MSMKKKGLHLNGQLLVNVNVTEKTIYGAKHIVVEGAGSIVGDSVMNDIYYPMEELVKLANATTGDIHAPSAHPKDDDGNFISATSTRAAHQNYIGAISTNYRIKGDRLIRDIAIDPEKASQSAAGQDILNRIRNREDTDTSTGLLMQLETKSGIGKDGEPYSYIARNMTLDHDAILLHEPGAAQSAEGVGMFANSKDDTFSIDEVNVNQSAPALNLPLAPKNYEWNQARAIQNIREYTGSMEKPTSNYRKFFMEFNQESVDDFESYERPFADIINGVPHAVFNAMTGITHPVANQYSDRFMQVNSDGIASKVYNAVKGFFATDSENEYNNKQDARPSLINNNQDKDLIMGREQIIAILAGKGITVNAEISDADLAEKLTKAIGGGNDDQSDLQANRMGDYNKGDMESKKKKDMEMMNGDFSKMEERMNAMEDRQKTMMDTMTKWMDVYKFDTNAKRDGLAKQVAGLDIGITEDSAKEMQVNTLEGIIAKNTGTAVFNAAGGTKFQVNDNHVLKGMEAPE